MSKSPDLAKKNLDHNLGVVAYTQPDSLEASLLSAVSGDGDTITELSGGGYARQPISFANAVDPGESSPSADVSFPKATAAQGLAKFCGVHNAGDGSLSYWGVLADHSARQRFVGTADDDTVHAPAHGLSNGDKVRVWGEDLPVGLNHSTIYYVVGATTDTLQVSTTSGGAAEAISADGSGWIAPDASIDVQQGVKPVLEAANFVIEED